MIWAHLTRRGFLALCATAALAACAVPAQEGADGPARRSPVPFFDDGTGFAD